MHPIARDEPQPNSRDQPKPPQAVSRDGPPPQPVDIVLATLNARYIHTAFGLRYLLANLGELKPRACLLEFDLQQRPLDLAETILKQQPRIVGLGVYIWNVRESLELVTLLKQIQPYLVIILGGPEVSYDTDAQPICRLADYVITGEADIAFAALCRQILGGSPPEQHIVRAEVPALEAIQLPYDLYTDTDLDRRTVYVEASRGCPFTCEFCLSSLDVPVRQFPTIPFRTALQRLLDRGLNHFKFVDRTFNLNLGVSQSLLEFFLANHRSGLFLHFEMIPDRLPPELREVIRRFPPHSLQFEVGIQTFNPEVAERIRRRQDYTRTEDNLRFLRHETTAHLHVDLIVGLPGEDLDSFAAGFDRLLALQPHEIQVGILKRLRGTPIARHDSEWAMVYRPDPPYDILCNGLLSFTTVQRLRRFARAWDLAANSGNFSHTLPLVWRDQPSAFNSFLQFTDWLTASIGPLHAVALNRFTLLLAQYLVTVANRPPDEVAAAVERDYRRTGRGSPPAALRADPSTLPPSRHQLRSHRRQQRHHPPPSSSETSLTPSI